MFYLVIVLKLQYRHKAEHRSLCQLHLKYMAEPFHDASGGGKQYLRVTKFTHIDCLVLSERAVEELSVCLLKIVQ